MDPQEPSESNHQRLAAKLWHPWMNAAAPHLLTAIVTIALTIALQTMLLRIPPSTPSIRPATTVQASLQPTFTPAPILTPPVPLAEGISRQELVDLRAEIDRLWATIYLTRSLSQIADAEAALRANEQDSVDQLLVAVDDSLALAYDRAADSVKNPIEQLRRDTGTLHDDLYLRPEGMDLRLIRLRQTILALIEERR